MARHLGLWGEEMVPEALLSVFLLPLSILKRAVMMNGDNDNDGNFMDSGP